MWIQLNVGCGNEMIIMFLTNWTDAFSQWNECDYVVCSQANVYGGEIVWEGEKISF